MLSLCPGLVVLDGVPSVALLHLADQPSVALVDAPLEFRFQSGLAPAEVRRAGEVCPGIGIRELDADSRHALPFAVA